MSKSQPGGAIWLDPELTSPYDYYQFWINVDDRDAVYFMKLYTFMPTDEIAGYEKLTGADIRRTKEKLAFEATSIAHGREEAEKARNASEALFQGGGAGEDAPTTEISRKRLEEGVTALDLFTETGLCSSRGEVRRMGQQGGLYIQGERVTEPLDNIPPTAAPEGVLLLRKGKKRYHLVKVVG
jgi:tyrosyl-tRNA synthetase